MAAFLTIVGALVMLCGIAGAVLSGGALAVAANMLGAVAAGAVLLGLAKIIEHLREQGEALAALRAQATPKRWDGEISGVRYCALRDGSVIAETAPGREQRFRDLDAFRAWLDAA